MKMGAAFHDEKGKTTKVVAIDVPTLEVMKRKFKRINIPPCPWHTPAELSYLAFFEDAEKRTLKGEAQNQCPVCKYWFWPHEFGTDPMSKIK